MDLRGKMQLQCCDFKDGPVSLFKQHRERPYYVYIRELVTFMERTVTIVTKRSAITDIHTRTCILGEKYRQSSYYYVDIKK